MGRIFDAICIILQGKLKRDPIKQANAHESIRVKALKRQVETLEEINLQYVEQIKALGNEVSTHRESHMQEKIIEAVTQLFMGNKSKNSQALLSTFATNPQRSGIPTRNHTSDKSPSLSPRMESGVLYSDSDLIQLAQSLPSKVVDELKSMESEKFTQTIKTQLPDISLTSIERARQILAEI